MPEGLEEFFPSNGGELAVEIAVVRLVAALLFGCVVAGVYRITQGRSDQQAVGLTATLVLLTLLICMVTLVIGNSVARAFSLVGALAIVRFRTVVEDTRDTAFVIFAVAIGMAIGCGYLVVPLVGIPLTALAAYLFRPQLAQAGPAAGRFVLTVRLGIGYNPDALLGPVFAERFEWWRLSATATARQGSAIDFVYNVRLRREEDAPLLIPDLNKVEGVQSAELRLSDNS